MSSLIFLASTLKSSLFYVSFHHKYFTFRLSYGFEFELFLSISRPPYKLASLQHLVCVIILYIFLVFFYFCFTLFFNVCVYIAVIIYIIGKRIPFIKSFSFSFIYIHTYLFTSLYSYLLCIQFYFVCYIYLNIYILICTLKTYACNINTKPPATHNTYYIHTLQHTISFYLLTAK